MPISSALGSSALLPAGLGFRNVVINGAMQIAQRSTSVASITSGESYRTLDRFVSAYSATGTWTQSQSTDAPPGFGNSIKFECTTANASLSAGSYLIWGQTIEGQNLQQFAKGTSSAKPFSLSFWVKAFQTGTYVAELYDNTNNRQVTKTFTINASATWEYKTIQFPADTTGAFANSNAGAFSLYFWLVAGTSYTSGTATGLWTTAVSANRAAGLSVNGASSTSNYFQFTGVQLEQNYQPTPFEQRPIGIELELCMRYYEKTYEYGTTAGTNTPNGCLELALIADASGYPLLSLELKARKRSAGYTITFYRQDGTAGQWTLTRYTSATDTNNNMTYDNKSESNARIYTTTATAAAREPCRFKGHYVVSDEL